MLLCYTMNKRLRSHDHSFDLCSVVSESHENLIRPLFSDLRLASNSKRGKHLAHKIYNGWRQRSIAETIICNCISWTIFRMIRSLWRLGIISFSTAHQSVTRALLKLGEPVSCNRSVWMDQPNERRPLLRKTVKLRKLTISTDQLLTMNDP
jgi:hypothetical protein